jgi:peptidoglycan/LPS O-acetylase OafA/YrhL
MALVRMALWVKSMSETDAAKDRTENTGRYPSVAERLAATENRPAGFDYLRIILATLIVADHAAVACLGMEAQRWVFGGIGRPILMALVPMFFSLSGFLVASSLARSRSLITFAGLRALRIIPALAVDTIFCALVIGVILTNEPLQQYFRSTDFYKYFLNIIGDIHYTLPGVFTNNPSNVVNSQLWTIPHEMKCYATLTGLAVLGLHRRPALLLSATVLIVFATICYVALHPVEITDAWPLLLPTFLLSVCAFIYRDKLPWNPWLFTISCGLSILLLSLSSSAMVFAAFPITYFTIWLGLFDPKRDAFIKSGDYSYPLYLYSFPIQQALITLVPWARVWWVNFLVAMPIAMLFAAFSWHLIEKPAQSGRRYLFDFEAWLRSRSGKNNIASEPAKRLAMNE